MPSDSQRNEGIASKWTARKGILIGTAVALGLSVIWFGFVDQISLLEKCPHCGFGRSIEQYCVFSFPIYERTAEHHTLLEKVAADLGSACNHAEIEQYVLQRLRGLCVPVGKTKAGTFFLGGNDSWYDEHISATVKRMAAENPQLTREFRKRALIDHDVEYLRVFWTEVKETDKASRQDES